MSASSTTHPMLVHLIHRSAPRSVGAPDGLLLAVQS